MDGFGDLQGEMWLGLENIRRLTLSRDKILRIDLWKDSGIHRYIEYSKFYLEDRANRYKLRLSSTVGKRS